MLERLSFYLRKIKRLRVGHAHGIPAPHKPLLLLTILDLIEQSVIQKNQITPSPQLVETYLKYWSHISLQPPRPFLPFYHLRTSGFWHLHSKAGQEAVLAAVHQFKGMPQLASVVAFASFDEDLFLLLLNAESREAIRQTIIDTYFPEQREIILSLIEESRQVSDLEHLLLDRARESKGLDEKLAPETPLRSAAFRGVIMKLYDYTCAACRLRIITLNGASAVDAAHIIPFAVSHDDGIGNGLALCKLHHWAFDAGLLTLNDNYNLLVSSAFEERGPTALRLRNLRDKVILLPAQKPFFPAMQAIRWHRENRFQQ